MANDVTDAMDLIAEALTDFYGERCPDVHPGCHCCEAWAQYDALAARPEPEGMETADEDIAILNRVAEVGILGTDPARVGRFVRDFDRLSAEIASLKARLAEAEAEKAETRKILVRCHDRIHALPRTSDTDLAIAIERLLGRLARGGRHEG